MENEKLEDLVAKVNYDEMFENYVPSEFAIKFINFIKMVNGEVGEENRSPLFHYKILDCLNKYTNSLVVAFRGSSKTTITSEYLFLYIATFGELDNFGDVQVAMYVGDTMENGCKNLRANIEHRYKHSEFLQKFIPHARFTDMEIEFENAAGHQFCVRMFGANVGVRGFKKYGIRPQLTVLDDLFTDKSAESPTITKDIENVIYKAVRQAMHPTKRKVIWIGTPFNKKDPLYKAAGSSSWHTEVFPICETFPCTKDEFKGAWEDRFSYSVVKREFELLRSNGQISAFNQELMLRITSDEDRLILDEDILWYTRDDILKNVENCNVYITTDFATSETQKSDFSVISVWALDHKGNFNWIDGMVKRQNMAANINTLFNFVELYKPLLVGVEVSGQQKGFVSWIKKDMMDRGIYFTLANDRRTKEEGLRPTTNKLQRFNTVVPLFKQRKIRFPKELKESASMLEFVDELSCATIGGFKSVHDDCLDTISMLTLLDYVIPYDPSMNVSKKEKVDNYDPIYSTGKKLGEDNYEYVSPYIV